MNKILASLAFLCLSITAIAQELMVKTINLKPFLEHTIVNDQSIFVLSKTYHLSLAEIADNNNELYKKGFRNGDIILIPINTLNYLSKPEPGSQPLYYIVDNNENMAVLSKRLNILPSMLQTWNNLPTPKLENGQKIIIGWLKYSEVQSYRPGQKQGSLWMNKTIIDEAISDSTSTTFSIQEQYDNIQIAEQQVNGLAVFYNNQSTKDIAIYYAFHNSIPKGSIVRIGNPLDQNIYIFATILGSIPKVQAYAQAMVVISDNAIQALLAETAPFFCNLYHK